MQIAANIHVDESELRFSFARSGGPGGQNVNKVNSKAILHWSIADAPGVPDDVKQRFAAQYGGRINKLGEVVLDCDESRSQHANREAVIERLKGMLLAVAKPPKPRKKSRPSKSALARRRKTRENISAKNSARRKVNWSGTDE